LGQPRQFAHSVLDEVERDDLSGPRFFSLKEERQENQGQLRSRAWNEML
jgi:hypothetical protein